MFGRSHAKRDEGTVHLEFRVNDEGKTFNHRIIKGLGYGCDEEALRIVRLMQYGKTKNPGIRISSLVKARIKFILPQKPAVIINYTIVPSDDKSEKEIKSN